VSEVKIDPSLKGEVATIEDLVQTATNKALKEVSAYNEREKRGTLSSNTHPSTQQLTDSAIKFGMKAAFRTPDKK
jgi:DNA-binding protein YbaB